MKYVPTFYLQHKMKEIEVARHVVYILDNRLYIHVRFGIWEKCWGRELTNEEIVELCEKGKKEEFNVVVCWTGSLQHRREQLDKYLKCEKATVVE